jgi:hypothetical protein
MEEAEAVAVLHLNNVIETDCKYNKMYARQK